MRSAKYALLAISLTFLTFFLVEVFNKRKVHPFQYILIGLALVLFYTLLVSISEHANFNIAYLVSSIAIIGIIAFYAIETILSKMRKGPSMGCSAINGTTWNLCRPKKPSLKLPI